MALKSSDYRLNLYGCSCRSMPWGHAEGKARCINKADTLLNKPCVKFQGLLSKIEQARALKWNRGNEYSLGKWLLDGSCLLMLILMFVFTESPPKKLQTILGWSGVTIGWSDPALNFCWTQIYCFYLPISKNKHHILWFFLFLVAKPLMGRSQLLPQFFLVLS